MEKHVLVRAAEVSAAISRAPKQGKNLMAPFDVLDVEGAPGFRVLEDCEVTNEAEVHLHEADLWLCLEGEVEFTCGGKLVNEWVREGYGGNELAGTGIDGGETFTMRKGDWLWIPVGVAHQHNASAAVRLVIIKIPKK